MIATSEAIAKTQRAFMAEILFQVPYNCREQAIALTDNRPDLQSRVKTRYGDIASALLLDHVVPSPPATQVRPQHPQRKGDKTDRYNFMC